MSQISNRKINAEGIRLIAPGGVGTGGYAIIGTAFEHAISKVIITTNFDKSVYLSIDGNNAFMYLPANSPPIEIGSFTQNGYQLAFSKGSKFYSFMGPDGVPTSGYLAITTFYGGN